MVDGNTDRMATVEEKKKLESGESGDCGGEFLLIPIECAMMECACYLLQCVSISDFERALNRL